MIVTIGVNLGIHISPLRGFSFGIWGLSEPRTTLITRIRKDRNPGLSEPQISRIREDWGLESPPTEEEDKREGWKSGVLESGIV